MRKATGLSRNRRKGAGPKPSNGQVQGTSNGNGGGGAANGTDGGGGENGTDRRKQTPEEAQLSTKNYRLAKELSELRVRHRDETKTVSRLTMENMNLASRCREAITHVAMLKKDLSVQQRRYEEAVKGGAAISTPGGPGATPISLPASPAATPELATPRTVSQVTPTSASRTPTSKQQTIRPGSAEKVPTPAGSTVAAARGRWEAQQQRQQQEAAAGNGLSANASEAGTSRVRQDDLFGETTRNTQPHLPSTPEKEDVVTASFPAPSSPNSAGMRRVHKQKATDIEMERPPAAVFSNATMVKARTEMSTMSSIDAFEASFASTFPASFSSSKVAEGPAPSLDIAFDVPDFSDPFYLGSEKDAGGLNFPETSNGRANGRSAQPVGGNGGNGMGRSRSAPSPKKTRGSGNQLFPSSPMRAINHGQGEGASGYGAGSSRSHVTPAMGVSDNGASPSAPEKAGASGSPRVAAVGKQAEISPASSESRRELSNSASIVLKRLQQRREKYKGGNASPPDATLNGDDQPDSTPGSDYGPKRRIAKADNSWQKQNNPAAANRFRSPRLSSTNKLSPSAMSAEMNELDAIAAQVGASSAAAGSVEIVVSHSEDTTLASNRRPVRNGAQPASYAEPPLNTKVRKGHEFFPKKEQAMA